MNIVSFYAPRPDHQFFQDYLPYLRILDASCKKFGHKHIVITDDETFGADFHTFYVELPDNLMQAVLVGQLAYLESPLAKEDTILIDGDCVLAQDPAQVFAQEFDMAFTTHAYINNVINTPTGPVPFEDSVLNNGVMYIRGGVDAAQFWQTALDICDPEWGGDQAALGNALEAQVEPGLYTRRGLAVRFMPEHPYNSVPDNPGDLCPGAIVLHFRGNRKTWMRDYCAKRLGIGELIEPIVYMNTDDTELFANIRRNCALPLNWVRETPAHDKVICLCGGGPSLKESIHEIRWRQNNDAVILGLNNAANYLAENGISPDYQCITDARPGNEKFIKMAAERYVLASQCDPGLIDAVPHELIDLIHCGGPGVWDVLPHEKNPVMLSGGVTSGLTMMCAAFFMGYRDIHLYGYDSSDREDVGSHAYAQTQSEAEQKRVRAFLNGKWYTTQIIMAKQAELFPAVAQMLANEGAVITVHGDGLLPAIAKTMQSAAPVLVGV